MSELRYQMDAYFQSMPEIDADRLASFIDLCEPGGEPCTVVGLSADELEQKGIKPTDGITITGFVAAQGPFTLMGLVHSVPSPGADMIRTSYLTEDMKSQLAAHQSFVLLTNYGGDDGPPVEKLVFLYKVGIGLCEQGALGLGLPHLGACFPADFMLDMVEKTKTLDSPDDKPVTLWRTLREDGLPEPFLSNYVALPPTVLSPDARGEMLITSRGFAHLGFPDLMYLAANGQEADHLKGFFKAGYSVMFEGGRPAWAAGHTFADSSGKGPMFRLSEPPDTFNPPFEMNNVLLVTREEEPKKKKWFGLFV